MVHFCHCCLVHLGVSFPCRQDEWEEWKGYERVMGRGRNRWLRIAQVLLREASRHCRFLGHYRRFSYTQFVSICVLSLQPSKQTPALCGSGDRTCGAELLLLLKSRKEKLLFPCQAIRTSPQASQDCCSSILRLQQKKKDKMWDTHSLTHIKKSSTLCEVGSYQPNFSSVPSIIALQLATSHLFCVPQAFRPSYSLVICSGPILLTVPAQISWNVSLCEILCPVIQQERC